MRKAGGMQAVGNCIDRTARGRGQLLAVHATKSGSAKDAAVLGVTKVDEGDPEAARPAEVRAPRVSVRFANHWPFQGLGVKFRG
jgi:hypothetical protein